MLDRNERQERGGKHKTRSTSSRKVASISALYISDPTSRCKSPNLVTRRIQGWRPTPGLSVTRGTWLQSVQGYSRLAKACGGPVQRTTTSALLPRSLSPRASSIGCDPSSYILANHRGFGILPAGERAFRRRPFGRDYCNLALNLVERAYLIFIFWLSSSGPRWG